jgi:hypothetical protein
LAVEILEKGQVRFWMQAEKLSGNAKVNYIFNEKEIFEGPVGFTLFQFSDVSELLRKLLSSRMVGFNSFSHAKKIYERQYRLTIL